MKIVTVPEDNDEGLTFVEDQLSKHAGAYIDNATMENNYDVSFHALDKQNRIKGAIYADIFWRAMQINKLWVDERYRRRGYGRALLARAEKKARRHCCNYIFTETASFEGPEFYKQAGFSEIGRVANYPEGHSYYFLKKKLEG